MFATAVAAAAIEFNVALKGDAFPLPLPLPPAVLVVVPNSSAAAAEVGVAVAEVVVPVAPTEVVVVVDVANGKGDAEANDGGNKSRFPPGLATPLIELVVLLLTAPLGLYCTLITGVVPL